MTSPIFIVGVPRSGTTLLRVMLDSHKNIACGPEFPLLTENTARIWGREWACVESFCNGISLKIFENFQFSLEDTYTFCAAFVNTIFTEYARRRNKNRWAIKVPRTVEKIDYLARLFPTAFFVHIIRDGRDVVASSLRQQKKRPGWYPGYQAENFGRDWVSMIRAARLQGQQTQHYYELHYEALIRNPEHTMRKLLSFLVEKWDEHILHHPDLQHDLSQGELSTEDVQKPLYTDAVACWKSQLNVDEINRLMIVDGFVTMLYK